MNPSMPPVYSADPSSVPNAVPLGPNTSGIPGAAPSVPSRPLKVKSSESGLIKTIVIILLTLLLIGAFLLAFYFLLQYRAASTDIEAQIDTAVATREQEIIEKKEKEFEEREKIPYLVFHGPADYGKLSFEYPKTWDLYIYNETASSSEEYKAYLHPYGVLPLSRSTVHALEVSIKTEDSSKTAERYKQNLDDGELTATVISVNGQDATRYDGLLPNDFVGSAVTFKIRDKIVTIQTDAEIYREDFNKIIESVKFNL